MAIKFIDETEPPKEGGGIRFTDEPEQIAETDKPEGVGEAPFMAQMGRGMMDVYQGTKQLAVNIFGSESAATEYNKKLAKEIDEYNKYNPNFQFGRLLGGLATPLALIPAAAVGTTSAKVVISTGAALGAASAITSPVETGDYWTEKGKQAAIGGTIGAAIPVAAGGAKTVVKWIDEMTKPLYKKGIERDVGKFLREYVSENKDVITKALDDAVARGDNRPIGQIIADASMKQGDDFGGMLVRLEKDLARESDSIKSIYARQSNARKAIIDSISGTEDDLSSAIAKRTSTGTKNYSEAFKVDVKADDNLIKILDNKYAKKATKDALDIAKVDGAKSHSQILHNVKIGLDKQLDKAGDDALSKAEKKAVNSVKKKLVGWIEDQNPQYKIAREQYALDSKPINKMLVGQEIKNSLVTSLEKDSPSKFAEGLRQAPRTIKRATGDSRFQKLDEILSKEDIASLNKIKKELAIEAKAKTMAGESKSIKNLITGEVSLSLPHILSRPVVITNHLLKVLGKDKTPEYKKVLIDMIKNPDKFTKIYGGPSENQKTKIAMEIVKRLSIISGSQQSSLDSGGQ
jgi:hypothetical protein